MKKLLLLFTIISHFAVGQNNAPQYNSITNKTTQFTGVVPKAPVWSATDTISGKSPVFKFETGRVKFKNLSTTTDTAAYPNVLVIGGDSLAKMSRSFFGGGGSATIDTTKVGRIEQGRGTTPIFMYFNGTAWVRNDTSYIPRTGADNITGNLLYQKYTDSHFYVGRELGAVDNLTNHSDYYFNGTGVSQEHVVDYEDNRAFVKTELGIDSITAKTTIGTINTGFPATERSLVFEQTKPTISKGTYLKYNISRSGDIERDGLALVNRAYCDSAYSGGGGSGTVTSVSVVSANGVSGSVATATTTPAITLSLGAITPTSVNSVVVSGSSMPSLLVVGSSTVAGSNTGDQTSVTGNAGTATALQTARTIGIATGDITSSGSSFDGTANNTNALTIANSAVTNAKIANATIDLTTKVTGVLPTANGGAGSINGILKADGSGTVSLADATSVYNAIGAQTPSLALLSPLPGLSNTNTATPTLRALDNTDLPYSNEYKLGLSGGTFYGFGDSFTQSQQATNANFGYINIFAGKNAMTLSNQSVSARGAYQAAINALINYPLYASNECTMLFGFNDVRRNGSASSTLNKINSAINSITAGAWMEFSVAASAVTNTGTWSNYTAITSRSVQKLSGNARQSSTSGNTLSYTTLTASTNLVIGCYGSNATTDYGRFTVTIDGTLAGTYTASGKSDGVSDGANGNTIIPDAFIIDGLSNQTHTVVITLLDNKVTPIDYIGYLRTPASCQGVFVMSIPRMNAAGYAIAPASANNSVIDAAKITMKSNCSALSITGRNVVFIDVDQYYNPVTCVGADFIHPNNLGYSKLAEALQSGVASSLGGGKDLFTLRATTTGSTPAYLGAFFDGISDYLQLATNRNPNTGVFANTGKAASQISLKSAASDAAIQFYTSATNNTIPSLKLEIDKNGLAVFQGAGSNASLQWGSQGFLTSTAANSAVLGTATFVSGSWRARGTNAGLLAFGGLATAPSISLYLNSSTTNNTNYTPTERIRFEVSNILFGNNVVGMVSPASLDGGIYMTDGAINTANGAVSGVGIASVSGALNIRAQGGGTTSIGNTAVTLGTGVALVGAASQGVFNTTSTTVSAFGAATSATIFGTPTTTATFSIGANATASGQTKTLNIGTAGASGSVTNINLGSATAGATSLITVNGALKLPVYTVATLPTVAAGTMVYVSDALTPAYNATVVGGGAQGIPVVYNGTNWTCH